jgi:hypothetical protein
MSEKDRSRLLAISCERPFIFYISCRSGRHAISGPRRRGEKVQRAGRGHNHRQEHEAGSTKFRVPKFVIFFTFAPSFAVSALLVRTWDIVVSDIIFHVLLLLPRTEIRHFLQFSPSSAIIGALGPAWDIFVLDIIFHFSLLLSRFQIRLSRLFFVINCQKSFGVRRKNRRKILKYELKHG